MKKAFLFSTVVCLFISSVMSADTFGTGANQFEIEFVSISGDASSANGTHIGAETDKTFTDPGNFRIGTYEITNDQWNKFKVAYGAVTGTPAKAYDDQDPYWSNPTDPVSDVSWYEAAQFVNWLNISTNHPVAYKFTGTQGQSNYTFNAWNQSDVGYNASNPFRNINAFYFLPDEDEWVKAAYWNGANLQTYANASAGDLVSGEPDNTKWNYQHIIGGQAWNVTSGPTELNGTHHMMGNVEEWLESPYWTGDYSPGDFRTRRGGKMSTRYATGLSLSGREFNYPDAEGSTVGFRVASIPEPATVVLLVLGGLALRKRRK